MHIWLVLLKDGCMEDVRPGVLQYFRFDICIFVFLVFFFFFWCVMYLFERRNSIFGCFGIVFVVVCCLAKNKQFGERKKK